MIKTLKENKDIFIGIFLPLLLVLGIVGYILIPETIPKGQSPTYSFIYTDNDVYYYDDGGKKGFYVKDNGKVEIDNMDRDYKFYKYDPKNKKSEKISNIEISKLRINTSKVAPDGYKLEYGKRVNGSFLFIPSFGTSRDYEKVYLSNGKFRERIYLNTDNYYDIKRNFVG